MTTISKDLEHIKEIILKDFSDPIPDKSIIDFLSGSSKMIRSTLAILYLKSFDCSISENTYQILTAGEIIHNASLLHDDVIDEADYRRSKSTIAKKFNSKISILAGDYLLAFAIEKLLNVNNIEILNVFKECTKKMSEAEIQQYFLRNKIPKLEEYIEICENKTAKLFSAILESSALLNNLYIKQAKELGILFGTYFQFKNDLNKDSANRDKINNIYTIKDILGVEKTSNLLDNYKEKISLLLDEIPKNQYQEELKDLLTKI